jgi:hypothetical protein
MEKEVYNYNKLKGLKIFTVNLMCINYKDEFLSNPIQ